MKSGPPKHPLFSIPPRRQIVHVKHCSSTMSAAQSYQPLPREWPANAVVGKRRPNVNDPSFTGPSQDESSRLGAAPRGSSSKHSIRHGPSRRWHPLYLRFGFLVALAIAFVVLMVFLAMLNRYWADEQGVPTTGRLRWQGMVFRYGPTAGNSSSNPASTP